MRGKASSATSCRCNTDRPHSRRHQVRLQIIDARFSIDVLKSLKLPVMDLFVKSALKNTSDSPSASISSRQRIMTALALYWQWTAPHDTGPALFSILSLIYASIQQDNGDSGASASRILSHLSIAHMASAPVAQPHIYNSWRSSGFALTPLSAAINKCRGIKPFSANISSCSESQWLCPGLHPSQGRGEACHDITQIFLKLWTSCSHKLRANHRRCHRTRRMYVPLWPGE